MIADRDIGLAENPEETEDGEIVAHCHQEFCSIYRGEWYGLSGQEIVCLEHAKEFLLSLPPQEILELAGYVATRE